MKDVLLIIFESVCIRIKKLPKKHLSLDLKLNYWFWIFSVLFIWSKYCGPIYGTLYYLCLDRLSYRVKEVKSKCSIYKDIYCFRSSRYDSTHFSVNLLFRKPKVFEPVFGDLPCQNHFEKSRKTEIKYFLFKLW